MLLATAPLARADEAQDFSIWVTDFKARAINEGVSPELVEDAFLGVTLDPQVVALDQKQPEKKVTLSKYLSNTINERRIRVGRAMIEEHRDALQKISAYYHVPANYIVALWAIESDYGNNKGNFSVVQSLATLAFEGRRREFFTKELIAALKIAAQENISPSALTGSWAGAMGDCQFMPTTYLRYAVDADSDGHRDIWNSPTDVLASIANYLYHIDWDGDYGWGEAVTVPADFTVDEADIDHSKSVSHWRKRGLTLRDGSPLPDTSASLYAIYPSTPDEGALLVTDNYKAILQWNRSRYFATAVGMLADQIGE